MLNTNFEPNSHFVVCFIYARAIKRGQNIHGILMKHPFDTHRVSDARSIFRFSLVSGYNVHFEFFFGCCSETLRKTRGCR